MMVARWMVFSNFTGSSTKPGAITVRTMKGIDSSIRIVKASSTVNRTPKTSSEKRLAPSMPFASISLAKSGTKAELNAPSAKSRRKVLGKRKAALKASATGPVPTAAAISVSRRKPKMRLPSVAVPTVANFPMRLMGLSSLCRARGRQRGHVWMGDDAVWHAVAQFVFLLAHDRLQTLRDAGLPVVIRHLLTEEISDVEGIDDFFTKCRDAGGVNVE